MGIEACLAPVPLVTEDEGPHVVSFGQSGKRHLDKSGHTRSKDRESPLFSTTLILKPFLSPSSLMIFFTLFTSQLPSAAGKKPTMSYCGLYQDSLDISFFFLLSAL